MNHVDPHGLYYGAAGPGDGEDDQDDDSFASDEFVFAPCNMFSILTLGCDSQNPAPNMRALRLALLQEWNALSSDCQNALKTAMPGGNSDPTNISRVGALNRALSAQPILEQAVTGTNIDWTMLAAIGVRETGFLNKSENDGVGVGVGVFQITVSSTSGVTAAQARNLTWAANWASQFLNSNLTKLAAAFPAFDPSQLLQATAASYNLGVGGISGNPNTIDDGSAHGNYGSNVLSLMTNCFN